MNTSWTTCPHLRRRRLQAPTTAPMRLNLDTLPKQGNRIITGQAHPCSQFCQSHRKLNKWSRCKCWDLTESPYKNLEKSFSNRGGGDAFRVETKKCNNKIGPTVLSIEMMTFWSSQHTVASNSHGPSHERNHHPSATSIIASIPPKKHMFQTAWKQHTSRIWKFSVTELSRSRLKNSMSTDSPYRAWNNHKTISKESMQDHIYRRKMSRVLLSMHLCIHLRLRPNDSFVEDPVECRSHRERGKTPCLNWNNQKTQSPKNECKTMSTETEHGTIRKYNFQRMNAGPYPQKKDVDGIALNAYLHPLEAPTNRFASTSSWRPLAQRTWLQKFHTWIPRDSMIQLKTKISPRSHIPPQQKTEINFQSNHCMSQSQTFAHRRFCTQTLLHTDAFTHRLLYTQTLLHTDTFTHRPFYTQTLLHTEAFTHRSFYTQKLLHTEAFTQSPLHTDAFTHRRFYIQTLLHTDTFTHAFTHRHFYTQKLSHTDAFTLKHFSRTEAFTHRSFYTQTLSHTQRPDPWNRNFTSVFGDRTSFRGRGCDWHLKIAILPQFLTSNAHFVRKGCDGLTKIALLPQFLTSNVHWVTIDTSKSQFWPQFLTSNVHFVRKGCDGYFKIAISPQFLTSSVHFVRKGRGGLTKIAISPQFLTSNVHFVWKGCDGLTKIAILLQFLTSKVHFVRKGCDVPTPIAILPHAVFDVQRPFRAKRLRFVALGRHHPRLKRERDRKKSERRCEGVKM